MKVDSLLRMFSAREQRTLSRSKTGLHLPWCEMQGYLEHKKHPDPEDHRRALGIVQVQGPRGKRFLMSEVPLYSRIREVVRIKTGKGSSFLQACQTTQNELFFVAGPSVQLHVP